jgi:hypothetical protein
LNPEFWLDLRSYKPPVKTKQERYIDALTVCFRDRVAYLCEISYSVSQSAMIARLREWSAHWPEIARQIYRQANIPEDWGIRIWLFVPEAAITKLVRQMPQFPSPPKITPLEMVVPWSYVNHDRVGEARKPDVIPIEMR